MKTEVPRRPWRELSTTAPHLPGGADKQVEQLIGLLLELTGEAPPQLTSDPQALDRIQKQISPLGLTHREAESVSITELGKSWLAARDPEDLFRIFHSQIAYFGEMLARIAEAPALPEDLLTDAVGLFGMSWRTVDQVRRRLMWLHAMGMVEDGPKRLHRVTPRGKTIATEIQLETPDSIRLLHEQLAEGAPLTSAPPVLAAVVERSTGKTRSTAWPYLTKAPIEALIEVALEAQHGSTKDEAITRVSAAYEISSSSAKSFVDTAGTLGIYEYTGKVEIRTTPLGLEWLDRASPLNLIRLLHARFSGVGEALRHLDETPRSTGDIHHRLFGDSETPRQNRTAAILRHLTAAGAAAAIGPARYVITRLGESLRDELPLPELEVAVTPVVPAEKLESRTTRVESLIAELEAASRDSLNPERFERACAAAFTSLGVEANHLGGPGRTDVLVTVRSSLKVLGRAIVDAKSASGQLAEGSIKFDALREHAAIHNATLMAVVAPGYEGSGRLTTWGPANGVVLLTAAELGELIRAHQTYPFTAEDIVDLLTVDRRSAVDDRHAEAVEHLDLVTSILRELSAEAGQANPEPVAARDIGRLMRRDGSTISDEEVDSVLRLLSQPSIGAVRSDPHGLYTLPSTPEVAATRLRALARAIERSSSALA